MRCKCYEGQSASRLCEPISPRSVDSTFCLNQCFGRGACESGYCRCDRGFHGADCSLDSAGSIRLPTAATAVAKTLANTSGTAVDIHSTVMAAVAKQHADVVRTRQGASEGGSLERTDGHMARTDTVGDNLRPRIYVYELPGEFNTFLLARRQANDACSIREYTDGMETSRAVEQHEAGPKLKWTNTLYGAEVRPRGMREGASEA